MKIKKLHIVISAFIILSIVMLFSVRVSQKQKSANRSQNDSSDITRRSEQGVAGVPKQGDIQEKKYDDPWDEWIEKRTELVVYMFMREIPELFTDRESLWEQTYPESVEMAKQLRKEYDTPPKVASPEDYENGREVIYENPDALKEALLKPNNIIHEGPQTPEAIMETYDTWYNGIYSAVGNIDETYPRAEWIQELIDMGVTFKTQHDYSLMMYARYRIADVEDKPEEWVSGKHGVAPIDNFEDYKKAYIQRELWAQQQFNLAVEADPEVHGAIFFDDAPDVILPAKKNRLYVYRDPNVPDVMKRWGEQLTTKQHFDLMYRGEHPEGWEVIYLDENYNVLSEKPPHVTREMVREWELPPENWTLPEGVELPEGFEEALRELGWKGTWTQELDPTEGPSPPDRATLAREAAEAERAAETEWRDFDRAVQEFERLANMSDAQLETEFQKMLITSLPGLFSDESIGKTLREQFSSARFENAEKLLQEYGAAEGFRRLAEKDAELARQIEDMFGKRSAPPQKSGRFVPREGRQPPPNAQPPSENEGK